VGFANRQTRGLFRKFPKSDFFHALLLGLDALPPVEETSGLQYRLNNLNYDCGPVNGIMTPATREAVRAFQSDHPTLAVTGDADAPTRERVRLVYGH